MKKNVQIAFAVALVILSILSIFAHSKLFDSIVLGVVIPSFILTIISFIDEVIQKCLIHARKLSDLLKKTADSASSLANTIAPNYKTESEAQQILDLLNQENEYLKEALDYTKLANSLKKCSKLLAYINITAYTILFLSLVLSPYIVEILAGINLNSITLWSLAILYLSNELKPEITVKCFSLLTKHYVKHNSQTKE